MTLMELLQLAKKNRASDIFIVSGQPLSYKADGVIIAVDDEKVMPPSAATLIEDAYRLANRDFARFDEVGDDDFALSIPNLSRLRISAYKQRGSAAAVIRLIAFGIPDYRQYGIPETVMNVSHNTKGLVLVTGPAGSGKSTTLACLIDRINHTRSGHIITIEEPIEFLYRNDKSIISQREVPLDTSDYVTALRACLRQAPDVILLGEMRDYDTIKTAMTAAETGHLILSTLHTVGAVNTIDRIIDIFPYNQQYQIRSQLAMQLKTVVSQQLLPATDGKIIPAFEIMHITPAIRTLIRDQKIHQIEAAMSMASKDGMITMDSSILELYRKGIITSEVALRYSLYPDQIVRKLGL
ncbi:MAG: PilT/PilU family type 4a pilus ATPase [Clostridiaceae bacterium]|nr:PilT/PilU family type 4a pilus ATPase [Clostridiaceae bacterium]